MNDNVSQYEEIPSIKNRNDSIENLVSFGRITIIWMSIQPNAVFETLNLRCNTGNKINTQCENDTISQLSIF